MGDDDGDGDGDGNRDGDGDGDGDGSGFGDLACLGMEIWVISALEMVMVMTVSMLVYRFGICAPRPTYMC